MRDKRLSAYIQQKNWNLTRIARLGSPRRLVAWALPRSLVPALRMQLLSARAIWEVDRQAQRGGVETPHALAAKYPKAGSTWAWFCMFPSPTLSIDPRSGVERRHHLYEDRLQRALKRAVREAEIANVPFLGALAGGSARRSERRVASYTSEEQRSNAPGSAVKNGILAFSASLMQAGISKPVSVHTLRHSFATHLLQGAARFRERQGTLQSRRIKRKIDRPVP